MQKTIDLHNIEHIVNDYLQHYGLTDWKFAFDRAKRRAGCCKYKYKLITLSYHYISNNPDDAIIDTVLHEIAHALVGPGNGHNNIWKLKCIEIGAKPERCCGADVKLPNGAYQAKCNKCGYISHKHRKLKKSYYCRKCGPKDGALIYQKVS